MTLILLLSYLMGIFWYIIIKVERDYRPSYNIFWDEYKYQARSNMEVVCVNTYYLLTTLSTIGLGDYTPVNSMERCIITLVMFGGIMMFSYLL